MSESALTFEDLQVHVASQLGVAYYGSAGDEVAQPPPASDTYMLQAIKDYVNGGIRMFVNDAPAEGWRFQQPVASVVLWATITTGVITVSGVGDTTMTSASSDFHPSMVGHSIVADTSGTSYTIISYTSATVIVVDVDASADTGDTFTLTADGDYTLPSTFGGEYLGSISYSAGSNPGASIGWTSEGNVRALRENTSSQTGYPSQVAIRKMDATDVARRWEMVVYPTPGGDYTIEFPYELYFTALSAASDLHPAGAHYDEAIRAACEAYAEMQGQDTLEGRVQYYEQKALPAAHRRNRRSAPRKLGRLRSQGRHTQGMDGRDHVARSDVTAF